MFFLRVILPAILAFISFSGLIFGMLIPGFENALMERKREMIKELSQTAGSLCHHYYQKQQIGLLTMQEAQTRTIESIRAIRYGNERKDYFWITDEYPVMIMHPYRPDLEGKDLSGLKDKQGKAMFREFVNVARSGNGGYVDYMWQWKDDTTRIVPKLSYVSLFKPWGWVIGTGIYVDDVKAEIRRIETNSILISAGICVLISVLLIFITRQSLQFERGRLLAEKAVRDSHERYRALAEAASEGVLIWSEHGLHANKTMLEWTGLQEDEIRLKHLSEIVDFPSLSLEMNPFSLYEELSTRKYAECTIPVKQDQFLSVHADLSAILLGDQKAVMLVARPANPVAHEKTGESVIQDNINCGFFRTSYSRRSRFLFASARTRSILGFNSLEDVSGYSIESFFADPDEQKSFVRELMDKKKITGRIVRLKNRTNEELFTLINLIVDTNVSGEAYCTGSIEMITDSFPTIPIIPSGNLNAGVPVVLDFRVKSLAETVVQCGMYTLISDLMNVVKESGQTHFLVNNPEDKTIGIISTHDLALYVGQGGSLETEAFRLMVSPPDQIEADRLLSEAMQTLNRSRTGCIIVTENEKTCGIITAKTVFNLLEKLPAGLIQLIRSATTFTELKSLHHQVQKTAQNLLPTNASPAILLNILSGMADEIGKRTIQLCLNEMQEPPVRFAFIQFGSAGRREQSFLTDQDNALVFDNVSPEIFEKTREYFQNLGMIFNRRLHEIGYFNCKGGMMAGNKRWCQPLEVWKGYFSHWANNPGPSELLEVSVFYDFSLLYGDMGLVDDLKHHLQEGIHTNDIFYHLMAEAWMPFSPEKQFHPNGISNLKTILMPLTGLVRLYALKAGVTSNTTLGRSIALYQTGIFSKELFLSTVNAWNCLMHIRLQNQTEQLNSNKDPDNLYNPGIHDEYTAFRIEKAIEGIRLLISKAETDFQTRLF